jgi:hypothetical protein
MYFAQALAYRNPRLLLDLAGYSISNNSGNSGSTTGTTDETTTVIKEKNCNRETTTTTKQGSTGVPSGTASSNNSALSKLSSINWTALTTQAETAYKEALQRRTESTILPLRHRGYRARVH